MQADSEDDAALMLYLGGKGVEKPAIVDGGEGRGTEKNDCSQRGATGGRANMGVLKQLEGRAKV